uniref:Uncharacterized protein n=1 Tax=Gopherus evgoodei TaxID=1825980 RepID=A0A8C4W0A0_9SAUR
ALSPPLEGGMLPLQSATTPASLGSQLPPQPAGQLTRNSNLLTPHIQGLYTPWPLSVAARPGTCPPDPIRCAHSAPAYCSSDPKCPREQKCCYVTCRFRCVDPAEDICQLPAQAGLCDVYSFRYFYNATSQRCEQFLYRGCRGNANNFRTKAECLQACAHHVRPGVCPALPAGTVGACDERCRSDSDCPGAQKCCSNGCGLACMALALLCPRLIGTHLPSCIAQPETPSRGLLHPAQSSWWS